MATQSKQPLTATQLAARARIALALEKIEAAQRLLGDACEQLCPINGLCPEWERVGILYDKVHAEWHRVNRKVEGGFDLDSDARRRFLARAEAVQA